MEKSSSRKAKVNAKNQEFPTFWSEKAEDLTKFYGTDLEKGLKDNQILTLSQKYGPNLLESKASNSKLSLFLKQFKGPVNLILIAAAILSLFVGDVTDSAIILLIVGMSGYLGFQQEYQAGNAVKELLNEVETKAKVIRNGQEASIPVEEVVPGDLLLLSAGGFIPGDSYILESNALSVDESALTGETFPVEKQPQVLDPETDLAKRTNSLWLGTHILSGSAKALVIHTARNTEFGKIYDELEKHQPETEFEVGVRKFGYMLMRLTLTLVMAIFIVNLVLKKPAFDSMLFSLALAVGLTPQLLPAIISVNLAHGAKRMAEKKVIVKKLSSIENFGSMNILCSDKTGTITSGKIILEEALNGEGKSDDFVFLCADINSSLQSGFQNVMDESIQSFKKLDLEGYRKIGEIPYNFMDKRLGVATETPPESIFHGKRIMVVKGALEKIMEVTRHYRVSEDKILDIKDRLPDIMAHYESLSQAGYRTLGVAYKFLEEDGSKEVELTDQDLTFAGYLTFQDPLKPGIAEVIQEMKTLGVELKIITGDNKYIAAHIADELKLGNQKILTGAEIHRMTETALQYQAVRTDVFAETDPNQKERIIRALKKTTNVIGYMGDGINDAAAISAADVGISVSNATDVAKGAASIVLKEQDLEVLLDGIKAGRETFANTLKYIFMSTSANFGNMFSMAGASLILPFLPLQPVQVLLTNLLTDFPEMQIAGDKVDDEMLLKPHRWNISFIQKFMFVFGLISSFFDFLTFFALTQFFKADQGLFQIAWFTESILSAVMVVFVIRTRKSVLKSRASRNMVIATAFVIAFVLILPYTPLASFFHFIKMVPAVYPAILLIVLGYLISAEIAKHYFYRMVKE